MKFDYITLTFFFLKYYIIQIFSETRKRGANEQKWYDIVTNYMEICTGLTHSRHWPLSIAPENIR